MPREAGTPGAEGLVVNNDEPSCRSSSAGLRRRAEERKQRPIQACSMRASSAGQHLRGRRFEIVEHIPGRGCRRSFRRPAATGLPRNAGRSAVVPRPHVPLDVLGEILDEILQPSVSPKNVTLDPTTGPRSSRTGASWASNVRRNLRRAFVGCTGASREGGGASVGEAGVDSGARRLPRRDKNPVRPPPDSSANSTPQCGSIRTAAHRRP